MAFCTNLERLRSAKGVSLDEAAHQIGITRRQLRRIEKGKAWATCSVLEDIAQYYDAPVLITVTDGGV